VNEYRLEVRITPRAGLLDPQGKAIQNALRSLDFETVRDVRVGRLLRLQLAADSDADARAKAEDMCRRLLANPVTEDFDIRVDGGT
jgi:phosphoribosylformylglycinamidine synthase PurS subunit